MADVYFIFNSNESLPNASKTWNELTGDAQTGATVLDEAGADSGFTITHGSLNVYNNLYGSTALQGNFTGDAAWCDEPGRDPLSLTDSGSYVPFTVSGLDNAKTYTLEAWGGHPSSDRTFDIRAQSGADVSFNGYDSGSGELVFDQVASITGISPSSGDIVVEFKKNAGSGGTAYVMFWRLVEETSSPSVSVDNASYTPGDTVTGTYSNFGSDPTTATLTDSGGQTFTPALTASGGTFSLDLGDLPAEGVTSALPFPGTVTVELS